MPLPTFVNSGRVMYDYAITGLVGETATPIPFLAGQTQEFPYLRESEKGQQDQVDTQGEPGERSLSGWWYRSQSSFDLGSGIEFIDTGSDPYLAKRFSESCGVDVFSPGQVSLLRSTTLAHSSAASQALESYSNGGEEGVLHANGSVLTKVTSAGATSSVTWGGASTILALCTDGGNYYAVDSSGIYRGALPGGAGTKIYNFGGGVTRAKIRYVKDRLLLATNEKVYEITNTAPGAPAALPTALDNGPQNGWTWSGIADGPDVVFMSGYAGDSSTIYAVGLDPTAAVPALMPPVAVAELPRGEVAYTVATYMGTFLIIGTSAGVRVGQIGTGGRVDIGPLSVESELPCKAVVCRGTFVWAGGSVTPELGADHQTVTNRYGLFRINLKSKIVDSRGSETGQFAYARDVYYGTGSPGTNSTFGVAMVGQTGRVAFALNGVGVVMEHATDLVARGYLTTARIRMDTLEDKVFPFLRISNSVTDGGITAQWQGESGAFADLYTWETDTLRRVDTEGSDGLPHLFVKYRFVLTRGNAAATNSPVLTGYQARVQPSNVTLRRIRLALQCSPREKGSNGQVIERETWSRIEAIEAAENRGAPVLFQDLGTGEASLCVIEKSQFVVQNVPQFAVDRKDPGGVLLLTLRKVV